MMTRTPEPSRRQIVTALGGVAADYRLLLQRLGLQRNVLVQPSTYGVDNPAKLYNF